MVTREYLQQFTKQGCLIVFGACMGIAGRLELLSGVPQSVREAHRKIRSAKVDTDISLDEIIDAIVELVEYVDSQRGEGFIEFVLSSKRDGESLDEALRRFNT